MIIKNFSFNINRCTGKPNCKSKEEIDEWIKDIQIDSWVVQQSMDFEVYNEKPIFNDQKYLRSWLLSPTVSTNVYQMITKNFISTKDSWFPNIETYSGEFYKITEIVHRPYHPEKFPNEIFRASSYLQSEATYYEREVFNFVDLIGELGGVVEIIIIVFGILIYPISKQSFILKASNQLFKARTKDRNLLFQS